MNDSLCDDCGKNAWRDPAPMLKLPVWLAVAAQADYICRPCLMKRMQRAGRALTFDDLVPCLWNTELHPSVMALFPPDLDLKAWAMSTP